VLSSVVLWLSNCIISFLLHALSFWWIGYQLPSFPYPQFAAFSIRLKCLEIQFIIMYAIRLSMLHRSTRTANRWMLLYSLIDDITCFQWFSIVVAWACSVLWLDQGEHVRSVRHFHYVEWPDMKVPCIKSMLAFVRKVRAHVRSNNGGGPIVVHCRFVSRASSQWKCYIAFMLQNFDNEVCMATVYCYVMPTYRLAGECWDLCKSVWAYNHSGVWRFGDGHFSEKSSHFGNNCPI
jgi:Protein-tyrosine phosphatase